ncbi:hypothetical protein [uncultured Tenacibaculum sp.]|uniref:hypothetical protein n=1 Tax=uncultured Tenacibaculum sp. TaxID=174713 RepID=UPI00261AE453|nr:hypothetical protein [uncultured Tenacibaculum sp.]
MKKMLFYVAVFLATINCYSQIEFEKGYFIKNNNERVECLIKNEDWDNNPLKFKYKLNHGAPEIFNTIESVKEFGVYNFSKYTRGNVDVDQSSNETSKLDGSRKPILKKETLFLKVLVEGKSNLYRYKRGNLKRFFYSNKEKSIKPLIYKRYLNSKHNANLSSFNGSIVNKNLNRNFIYVNERYKQQLFKNLTCKMISLKEIEKLRYKKQSLSKFFIKYNKCSGYLIDDQYEKETKGVFKVSLKGGVRNTTLDIDNSSSFLPSISFDSKTTYKIGVEGEYFLPFNKNKWSLFVEPTFQFFSAKKELPFAFLVEKKIIVETNYKSIEVPIGIKRYFFLNDVSKMFIGGSVVLDFNFDSYLRYTRTDGAIIKDFIIRTSSSIGFHIGYVYKNDYSLELTYQNNRDFLTTYSNISSKYSTMSITIGYTF